MFDLNIVSKRYFTVKINNTILHVEPPKIKVLKKITALSKSRNEDAMEDLSEAVKMILNKNKKNYKVTSELVDELDFDQLNSILTAYFEWLSTEKNSKN